MFTIVCVLGHGPPLPLGRAEYIHMYSTIDFTQKTGSSKKRKSPDNLIKVTASRKV